MNKRMLLLTSLLVFILLTIFFSTTLAYLEVSPMPTDLSPNAQQSDQVQLFTERLLDNTHSGYTSADGSVAAGTCINSYLLHYDSVNGGTVTDTITFDTEIIAVFWTADDLDATDPIFGNPNTNYAPTSVDDRRLESKDDTNGDWFEVSGATINLKFKVADAWRDQARVITSGDCVKYVDIDVQPSDDGSVGCMNNDDHGVIPVVIFGSAEFDVHTIDVGSISFEGMSVAVRGKADRQQYTITDYNGDGYEDMEVKIADGDGYSASGSSSATLTGNISNSNDTFSGTDVVCVVQN